MTIQITGFIVDAWDGAGDKVLRINVDDMRVNGETINVDEEVEIGMEGFVNQAQANSLFEEGFEFDDIDILVTEEWANLVDLL